MVDDGHTREQFLRSAAVALLGSAAAAVTPREGVALADTIGHHICRVGRRYIGVRYVHNGKSLRTGLDCDAYVKRVMNQCGIYVPWGPEAQFRGGRKRRGHPHMGDVVAFAEKGGRRITHVGIYSGGGRVLHASTYFGEVIESRMKYVRGFRGARVYR